jgi:hypothetical protein
MTGLASISGFSARRLLIINRLDAIIEISSKLGFHVGLNFLGDFPEFRNIGFQLIHFHFDASQVGISVLTASRVNRNVSQSNGIALGD